MSDRPSVPQSGPRPARRPRVLIADADVVARGWLKPIVAHLDAEIVEVGTGLELQLMLTRKGPFDLVITNARLPAPSGLQVLATVRAAGSSTPFIVVTSFQQNVLRVFVSDAEGTVLSSRVVDADNLGVLARNLISLTANGSNGSDGTRKLG
ncbi:MAG: response regulator [Polyangiaceae bacterium]